LAAKEADNQRDEGGDGQQWALAFESGNERQQQKWQWRMTIALMVAPMDNGKKVVVSRSTEEKQQRAMQQSTNN
jgi:hypothetical protein